MNKLFYTVLAILLTLQVAVADCDWKTIEKTENGYLYNKDCHVQVGKLVKEAKLRKEQVAELSKTITLKDLAMTKANERIDLWRDTSFKLEERIIKQRKWSSYNDYLYFGGGVVMTILAGWALGQASR